MIIIIHVGLMFLPPGMDSVVAHHYNVTYCNSFLKIIGQDSNSSLRCWFMWASFYTYRRGAHPFGSCGRHSTPTEEVYMPLVHVGVILHLQKRCTCLWFMWASFYTYRRGVHAFGSCGRHSTPTEEVYMPLVHVGVILHLQKRCTCLWFMWASFYTYRRGVHAFGSCRR